jgi:hypothetical protein
MKSMKPYKTHKTRLKLPKLIRSSYSKLTEIWLDYMHLRDKKNRHLFAITKQRKFLKKRYLIQILKQISN